MVPGKICLRSSLEYSKPKKVKINTFMTLNTCCPFQMQQPNIFSNPPYRHRGFTSIHSTYSQGVPLATEIILSLHSPMEHGIGYQTYRIVYPPDSNNETEIVAQIIFKSQSN
jgi:hypothetical protein